jgi:phage/plasmid-like protein (TIGR03299 family)
MSHNINFNEATGTHSFISTGARAWHDLGQSAAGAMTAEEAVNGSNMNFIVDLKPIAVAGGKVINSHKATVRRDTKDVLGIVSPNYAVIQNHEAFSFFDTIVDSGEAIYETAGVLGKGEKVFITAKLPSDILVHGESVENYLLLTSGHDGRSAVQIGFTSIRVVCNNTLTAALKNLTNKMVIPHFKGAKARLETAAAVMGFSSKYTQEINQIFNKMAEVKIDDAQLRKYIETVMKPARKEILTAEDLEKEFSTRFTNTIDDIMNFAHTNETQLTDAAFGTVWGAYNAVSGYYCHLKEYKTADQKMKDIYFKIGSQKIEHAFDVAASMI